MMKTLLTGLLNLFLSVCFAKPDEGKVYLFAYFNPTGEAGLHLAYSRDGYKWTALNNDRSFLKPEVGTGRSSRIKPGADTGKIMRDPCIIRADDGTFHMVWTAGWEELGIGYVSSNDLVHWSTQKYIPVMQHEPAALNCWAPEIIYDELEDQFLVFWATTIPGRFPDTEIAGDRFNHRIYYLTTKDFESFSETKLFYDKGFNVIDATINKDSIRYIMFVKNESSLPPQKNIRISISNSIYGPYGDPSSPITGSYWCEGPTSIKIGDTWFVYFDKYVEGKMGAVTSEDLVHWNDISEWIDFPEGGSHGTVFPGTEEILNQLISY